MGGLERIYIEVFYLRDRKRWGDREKWDGLKKNRKARESSVVTCHFLRYVSF